MKLFLSKHHKEHVSQLFMLFPLYEKHFPGRRKADPLPATYAMVSDQQLQLSSKPSTFRGIDRHPKKVVIFKPCHLIRGVAASFFFP